MKLLKYIKLNLADSNLILKWGSTYTKINKLQINEITESNYFIKKNNKIFLNPYSLFSTKIYGPLKSWTCLCNKSYIKYQRILKNLYCSFCFTEINTSLIRRYRIGIIILNFPIIHTWYIKSGILANILNISNINLENLIYYKKFFYLNTNKLKNKQFNYLISNLSLAHENIYKFLNNLNLYNEIRYTKELIYITNNNNLNLKLKIKLKALNIFYLNKISLKNIYLFNFPVISPILRPLINYKNKYLIISDINNIYKKLIIENNKLLNLIYLHKHYNNLIYNEIFYIVQKKLIQLIIDSILNTKLIYNTKNLKSPFLNILQGKEGLFRNNILGKRVDFSGRLIIIPNYNLNFNTIGLPFFYLYTLYKPFILYKLKKYIYNFKNKFEFNLKLFKILLNKIINKKIIFINRAPTLHKLNIQSYKISLNEGYNLQFFPLSCTCFNADFDGDQMSIYLPLSYNTQLETKNKLYVNNNIFNYGTSVYMFKLKQNLIINYYFNNLFLLPKNKYIFYFNLIDELKLISLYTHLLNLNYSLFMLKINIIYNSFKYKYYIITNLQNILNSN